MKTSPSCPFLPLSSHCMPAHCQEKAPSFGTAPGHWDSPPDPLSAGEMGIKWQLKGFAAAGIMTNCDHVLWEMDARPFF